MNNETLSEILDCMAFALNSTDKLYHKFSPNQIAKAKQKLKKLIERDTAKMVIPEKVYFAPKDRRAYHFRFLCPGCKGIVVRGTNRMFCNNNNCGQRLKWSE